MELYQAETTLEKFVRLVLTISVASVGVGALTVFLCASKDVTSVQFWIYLIFWVLLLLPILFNGRVRVRRQWDSHQRKNRCLVQAEKIYSLTLSAILAIAAFLVPTVMGNSDLNGGWVQLASLLPIYLVVYLTVLCAWIFRDSFREFTICLVFRHVGGCFLVFALSGLSVLFQNSSGLNGGILTLIVAVAVCIVAIVTTGVFGGFWSFIAPQVKLESNMNLNSCHCFKDQKLRLTGINKCVEKSCLFNRENPDTQQNGESLDSPDLSRLTSQVNRFMIFQNERHELEKLWAFKQFELELRYWESCRDLRRRELKDDEELSDYRVRMCKVNCRVLKQKVRDNLSFRVRNVYQVEWVRSLETLRFKFFCALCRLVKGLSG